MSGYATPVGNDEWLNSEFRNLKLTMAEANRRALANVSRVRYGVIDPLWTYGPPRIKFSDEDTYDTIDTWDVRYTDPQPGGYYACMRTVTGGYHILGKVNDTRPFLNQIPLPLASNWRAYDTNGWGLPTVTKTSAGMVVLSGLIRASGTPGTDSLIATLPVGFRPDYALLFGVNNSDQSRAVTVWPDGRVTARSGFIVDGYVSFAGIAFPAAGVASWTFVGDGGSSFSNGWVENSSTSVYGRARYWKDPNGMVWVQGLIRNGSIAADNTNMVVLPVSYRPKSGNHIVTQSQDNFGFVGINTGGAITSSTNGLIQWKGGSSGNSGVSLCGVVYESATSTINWSSYSLANGWVNYQTATFTSAEYAKMPDGLVHHHGLIRAGTVGGSVNLQFPSGFRGSTQSSGNLFQRVVGLNPPNRGRLDFRDGYVVAQQGTNVWFSLDAMVYVPEA